MKRRRVAVVGFGKEGKACAEAVHASRDLALAGIVPGPAGADQPIPDALRLIPVVAQVSQVHDVAAALICLPADVVAATTHDCLQHAIATVDCVPLRGAALQTHREAVHRMAVRYNLPAVVGAGWDPGGLSLFRALFALLVPGGHTQVRHHVGIQLHHTAMPDVRGVSEALAAERVTVEGRRQRLVYVELERGADPDRVIKAIQSDPLYADVETQVFPVESLAAFEQEGRGVVLERRGGATRAGHHQFLLEARYEETVLTVQVMMAVARALPRLKPGAYILLDVPFSALWGDRWATVEQDL